MPISEFVATYDTSDTSDTFDSGAEAPVFRPGDSKVSEDWVHIKECRRQKLRNRETERQAG